MEPVLVALLCADSVIVEHASRKRSIIGSFARFYAKKVPVVFPPWWVYLAVDNVSGTQDYRIVLAADGETRPVVEVKGQVTVASGASPVEMQFRMVNAVFKKFGAYNLIVSMNGSQLGGRVLHVTEQKPPPPSPN